MNRVNTVDWSTVNVLTKFSTEFIKALVDWQRFTIKTGEDGMIIPIQLRKRVSLGGDSEVIVAAIQLRDKLNQIIERSSDANKVLR